MIEVTRLNGEKFFLNDDQIDYFENNPDTLLYLRTGNKLVVKESAQEVVDKIIAFRRQIYMDIPRCTDRLDRQ